MHAIEITNLSKTFKGKKGARVEALKALSLNIEKGEVFGFLGPNGAGKTTTMKILMGLTRPTSGVARIMGYDVSHYTSRLNVGYLPENPSFYDYLNAEEYLIFVGRTFGMDAAILKGRIEDTLRLLDLWDDRRRRIREYSKGMVQRLGLAQALLHDPEVYILDEPMSGLDPLGRALVKDVIKGLKARGRCVFFSTHITDDVEAVCDRVGIILNGTLQVIERVDTILSKGILGYHLRVREKDDDEDKGFYVSVDRLPEFMNETLSSGRIITMIEPKRKNLEEFFLDIVKR